MPAVLDNRAARGLLLVAFLRRYGRLLQRLSEAAPEQAISDALSASDDVCAYAVSRAWAAALHAHPDRPDGIRYRARHDDDGFAVALFDRAKGDVHVAGGAALDDERAVPHLTTFAERYGVGLA